MMAGNIYLIREDQTLVAMSQQPYDSEELLQRLLADYPSLLAGEQITDESPRRWLLVSREAAIASEAGGCSWYADHLYLDQDGIPTLVEVKRSTDTRIRREVVGQMLDYAANLTSKWKADQIRLRLETTPEAQDRLQGFLAGLDPDEYWRNVDDNLTIGRVRMIFVADHIPSDLRVVVNFLANQFRNAEVYAVEVRNFQSATERALVPSLVSNPKPPPADPAQRRWDERSLIEALRPKGPERTSVCVQILSWAHAKMPYFWFGRGSAMGSCFPQAAVGASRFILFALWTYGNIELQFQHMSIRPFDELSKRIELIDRLNKIDGIVIPPEKATKRPSFDMALLSEPTEMKLFLETMEWAIQEARFANSGSNEEGAV